MTRLWTRLRTSRAAALPEYAMVFSVLLGGSLALYQGLEDESQATVEDNASAIGALPTIEGFAVPDGTSGTTTSVAPTTTAAPTTSSPATTASSTSTSSTTVPAPTTTEAEDDENWIAVYNDQSYRYWSGSCSCYRYAAKWHTHIKDSAGVPLRNGRVRWRVQAANGTDFTTGWYTFNNGGNLILQWTNRRSYHFPVTVTIEELETAAGDDIEASPDSFTMELP